MGKTLGFDPMRVDPHYKVRGAAPTFEPVQGEFTRVMERFSDDQLAIVWRFSGLGFDPETQRVAPFPGREVMVKFVRPIPGSWRDILRRAVRTMGNRPELAALRKLLSAVLSGHVPPVRESAPAPVVLTDQCHRIATAPVRGSPVMTLHVCPVIPGAPPT